MTDARLLDRKALTLETARKIADAAMAEAVANNARMAIAIVDDGGHLLHFLRMDNVAPAAAEVGLAKARSAALFGRATKAWEEIMAGGRIAVASIPNVMPLGGGVPLVVDGMRLGAIGASGSTSAMDDQVAQAGAKVLEG